MTESLRPGTPLRPRVFAILLLLAEGPRHGYGLMRELSEGGVERWSLGPATLYRTLKHLVAEGLIAKTAGPAASGDGPPRTYYELTPRGRRLASVEAARMAALVTRARAGRLLPADGSPAG